MCLLHEYAEGGHTFGRKGGPRHILFQQGFLASQKKRWAGISATTLRAPILKEGKVVFYLKKRRGEKESTTHDALDMRINWGEERNVLCDDTPG